MSDAGDDTQTGGDAGEETGIRPLDRTTVERIAAGEVVERPASVVKELVENAIDADASRIEVHIEGDGTEGIRVRDDGHGMSEADVRVAVREHTTSKIADIEDLESGVGTLGFRGEALHTIGAVSRTTITTRPRGSDGAGTRLRYEGGEVVSVEPAGCPEGTTVAVEDLFYNTPARRKYLKQEATEFAHVNRIVSRYALANPDVAVTLDHDGRETFSTPGRGDLREALLAVYGREVAEAMIPVVGYGDPDGGNTGGSPGTERAKRLGIDAGSGSATTTDLPDGPLSGLAGFVSHPETTRSSREYVTAFVNGRYVRADVVREAVLEAYGGQLAAQRYPFVVLFLDLPAGGVDVNVHPRKMEVRFDDEDGLRSQVRTAVREALLNHGLLRSSAPRGRSAPDETPVDPTGGVDSSGGDGRPGDDGPVGDDGGGGTGVTGSSGTGRTADGDRTAGNRRDSGEGADPGGGSGRTDPVGTARTADSGTGSGSGADTGTGSESGSDSGTDTGSRSSRDRVSGSGTGSSPGHDDGPGSGTGTDRDRRTETEGGDRVAARDPGHRTDPDDGTRRFGGGTEQRTLSGGTATPEREYDRLPPLRVLGQFDETYVVCETPDGLALVDQHAADERVNYERLRAAFEGETTAQRLADPVALELTPGEAATFEAAREAPSDLGFEARLAGEGEAEEAGETESCAGRTLQVEAVPAVFDATLDPDRLRDLLAEFVAGGDPEGTVADLADDFLADLACHPSITGNTSLTEGSVLDLLAALDDCENPYACPHGRPVVVELDREEVEARFERDYPGHGERRE